mmetsp:Transcript_54610/g.127698  ORF Transcript_54610/g.127698 Transcript_54610/m.127698 type:complete len:251 (+) Transcript_54610:64-816(+)
MSSIASELACVQRCEGRTDGPFYLIDALWLQDWRRYVSNCTGAERRPGPISNNRLVNVNKTVGHEGTRKFHPRKHLKAGQDYRGVCGEVWRMLQQKYGGGPAITSPFVDLYNIHVEIEDMTMASSAKGCDPCSSTSPSCDMTRSNGISKKVRMSEDVSSDFGGSSTSSSTKSFQSSSMATRLACAVFGKVGFKLSGGAISNDDDMSTPSTSALIDEQSSWQCPNAALRKQANGLPVDDQSSPARKKTIFV